MNQNFTIFLKYEKCVKKLSIAISLSTITELYDIAIDRFYNDIGDSNIELYLQDKEFGVYCELEDCQQLYHGVIIEIRIKENSSKSRHLNSSFCSQYSHTSTEIEIDNSVDLLGALVEADLNLLSNEAIKDLNLLSNETATPTYASIVTSNSSSPTMKDIKINTQFTKQSVINVSNENNFSDAQDYYTIPLNRYYILLTGVPYTASDEDIISFFKPVPILNANTNGIFFVTNYQGKPIGHVFVVFENKINYELAFKKNGSYIGDRYIQILDGKINEFEKSVRIYHGINMKEIINKDENCGITIVKLKGFSFEIDECAIREWLESKLIIPAEIYIMYDYRNRNSGIAYLEFKNETDSNAVFEFNNEYLGNRYINVFRSTLNELKLSLAQICGTPINERNFNPYLHCLRIKGMAGNCKHKHIISFFKDTICISPKQIYINKKNTSIIAYAEFNSQFDCQLALTRNHTYLNDSLITLIQVSKYELRSVAEPKNSIITNDDKNGKINNYNCTFSAEFKNYHSHTENNNKENLQREREKEKCKKTRHLVSIRGIPFTSKLCHVAKFFEGYNSMDPKSLRFIMDHKGRFCGQATVEFYDRHEARKAVNDLDRKYIGNRYVLLRLF